MTIFVSKIRKLKKESDKTYGFMGNSETVFKEYEMADDKGGVGTILFEFHRFMNQALMQKVDPSNTSSVLNYVEKNGYLLFNLLGKCNLFRRITKRFTMGLDGTEICFHYADEKHRLYHLLKYAYSEEDYKKHSSKYIPFYIKTMVDNLNCNQYWMVGVALKAMTKETIQPKIAVTTGIFETLCTMGSIN
jgi:hypothetical protein